MKKAIPTAANAKILGSFVGLFGFLTTIAFAVLSPSLFFSWLEARTINSIGQIIKNKFRINNLQKKELQSDYFHHEP